MQEIENGLDTEGLRKVIGERVKKLRESAARQKGEGLSQADLAKELTEAGCPITQSAIGHIEVGRKLPSLPVLVALANYFDTSLDYIVGRTDNESSLAAIEEDLQTGGTSGRLGEIYRRLSPARREEVYNFALALEMVDEQIDGDTDREITRYVGAMLDAFEKRIGARGIESVLDELGREFPDLSIAPINLGEFRKKKRG